MPRPTDAEMAEWERGLNLPFGFDGVPVRTRLREMFSALVSERERADEAEEVVKLSAEDITMLMGENRAMARLWPELWYSRRMWQERALAAEVATRRARVTARKCWRMYRASVKSAENIRAHAEWFTAERDWLAGRIADES